MQGQLLGGDDMPGFERQELETRACNIGFQIDGCRQFADRSLDGNFPKHSHANQNPVLGIADGRGGCRGQESGIRQPPEESMRVEEERHGVIPSAS